MQVETIDYGARLKALRTTREKAMTDYILTLETARNAGYLVTKDDMRNAERYMDELGLLADRKKENN
jgi:phage anti-repressor protein